MSTFDYPGIRAITLDLLQQFGNAITLTREGAGGSFNPGSGGSSGGSDLILNGTGVLLEFNKREIDGTNILSTDRKLLFQGDAIAVNDDYKKWRVYAINNLDPDESGTILTTAQMRK